MSIRTKVVLSAAIVLSAAVTASAAPKQQKRAVHQSGPQAQATVPRNVPFSNPNSPEATGGGSLGYNRSVLIAR
jgi:hypothetical protein